MKLTNKTDIIIFSGQSNMQGQTECLSDTTVKENCYEYRLLTDEIIPLKNPVGEWIKTDGTEGAMFEGDTIKEEDKFKIWLNTIAVGPSTHGNTNIVPAFCEAYHKKTGRDVLAVHAAKGATRICKWLKGEASHEVVVKKARAAMEKCTDIGGIYFVWLQGENDAGGGVSQAEYEKSICDMKNAFKEELGINKFGIIRMGNWTNDERDSEIHNAQENVCTYDEDFIMLSRVCTELTRVEEYMNPEARGHYSAKGAEIIGKLAGSALGEYVK